jgi:hypothetical protein
MASATAVEYFLGMDDPAGAWRLVNNKVIEAKLVIPLHSGPQA